jgi:hypothetical protein
MRYPTQRPEFLGEEFFYLLIGHAWSKQPDELLPHVASIHIQGEQTAIFATDSTQRSLKFGVVII